MSAGRPSEPALELAIRLLRPYRALAAPSFRGLERIPDERPLLFVGNHTLYGVLDIPLLFAELWQRRGIFLRSLGDHAHFDIPVWRDLLTRFGAVDGTRENCAELMRAGEAILVFPGGGREVAKRRGERYQLLWKERLGFARMAIQHQCTIVPFAAVGVEHAFDIVLDANDVLRSPLGKLIRKLGLRQDIIPPLVRGLGPTPLPRPERLYFGVGDAIPTRDYSASDDDCRALRDRVRAAVEAEIAALLARRSTDPKRTLGGRIARRLLPGRKR